MLKDKIGKYRGQDMNCAETILLSSNEEYNLGLTIEDVKLVSAFGGGCGCDRLCGALAGSLAVLGKIRVDHNAHNTDNFRAECAGLVEKFNSTLGHVDCEKLMPLYKTEENGCGKTIELAAEVLGSYLATLK